MATDQFLSLPDVLGKVGLCKAMVYRLIQNEKFPAPAKIGRASRWSQAQVDDWMKSKLAA